MVESSTAEALIFFDDHEISKEMTYDEFQAILDNYVPMQDLSGRTMQVAYVRVNSELLVTAAVFFLLPFDSQGFVEKSWNIPLQHLADASAKGPNLGAGPITLACYSQCPIEWHQQNMWDPQMQAPHNDFISIKKTIKNNSLGFIFNVGAKEKFGATDDNEFDEERTRAAILLREQRLKYRLLQSKSEQDVRQLSIEHQERLLNYQQKISDYQDQLSEQRKINSALKDDIAAQQGKIDGMRDYFENKLRKAEERAEADDSNEIESLREHYEAELLLRVESVKAELESKLKAREVEMLYRSEREAQLQQEILKLQRDQQALRSSAGNGILERLTDAGVSFVIYHPGAGHLTLKANDITSYLDSPIAFVAKHCGVNEQIYSLWLDHFYSPTCQHHHENGAVCDASLQRLDEPSQFILGESDRCPQHRTQSSSVVNISRHGRLAKP